MEYEEKELTQAELKEEADNNNRLYRRGELNQMKSQKLKLNEKTEALLKKDCNAPEDCQCQVRKTSKWQVEVTLVNGLCVYGKYKVNVRTRKLTQEF